MVLLHIFFFGSLGENQSEQCCAMGWDGPVVVVSILVSFGFSYGTKPNSQVLPSVYFCMLRGVLWNSLPICRAYTKQFP
jgi:hypothetical protein